MGVVIVAVLVLIVRMSVAVVIVPRFMSRAREIDRVWRLHRQIAKKQGQFPNRPTLAVPNNSRGAALETRPYRAGTSLRRGVAPFRC